MDLFLLKGTLAVSKLPAGAALPAWAWEGDFCAVTRTADELSVVCAGSSVAPGTTSEAGWRALKVAGPLVFSEVGILSALSAVLAEANISIFVISTFDTDYLLVKEAALERAIDCLRQAGHQVKEQK